MPRRRRERRLLEAALAGAGVIPVRGYAGHKVAVLGLGRSGLPTVAALRAGAEVVAWDDGAAARERAADGIALPT